ncbi:DUF1330 domain-containing protein [Hyphomonas sp.]|uniref:DUF1330 domain-containing protein n=1 Tax=Hyphomonas sp. TaxID=87 RepID=UPI001DDA9CB6|nr:DUF1330 domain-containing protein [Hyphomonas sp.]MBU4061526.1 DUF1330 domain-containing protein [Alphaproteobacteria bacterium]
MSVYFVGEVEVRDHETYAKYAGGVAPLLKEYRGEVLAMGGELTPLEGEAPAPRVVIVRFPSLEIANAFLQSEAYQSLAAIRRQCASARTYIVAEHSEEVGG